VSESRNLKLARWALFIASLLVLAAILWSCGGGGTLRDVADANGSAPDAPDGDEPGAAAQSFLWLAAVLLWGGRIAVIGGLAGYALSWFVSFLRPFRSVFAGMVCGGIAALFISPVFKFLGDHYWLSFFLIAAASLVGFTVTRLQWVERALYRFSGGRIQIDLDGDGKTGQDEIETDRMEAD
jgi:hypothetical protein